MRNRTTLSFWTSIVALSLLSSPSRAQGVTWTESWVGSEWELYARALAVRGVVGGEPWALRPFAPSVIRSWAAAVPDHHPWSARLPRMNDSSRFALLRPALSTSYNSDFAWGLNDGPVWQGKGINVWGTAGFAARAGPFSMRVEPLFDYAENQSFSLAPVPVNAASPFVDDMRPFVIDLPQRFGSGGVKIIDPGQSYVRIDLGGVAAGISTEDLFWGPGVREALLFGPNAAGFPHAFIGTSRLVSTPIGGFHGQVVYGRLQASDWAPQSESIARLGAGAIGIWVPTPTIELGAARFIHRRWHRQIGGEDLFAPFTAFINRASADAASDNQLITLFASIRVPTSGFEVFGEFGKNDRNSSVRDLASEPEHNGAWLLGVFGIIGGTSTPPSLGDYFWTIRAEAGDGRITPIQQLGRPQSTFYDHTALTQGHTESGQLLGSPLIDRSGGGDIAIDLWTRLGRLGVSVLERQMPGDLGVGMPATQPRSQWDMSGSATAFLGAFDISAAFGRVWDLNRFPGNDVSNYYGRVSLRAGWR